MSEPFAHPLSETLRGIAMAYPGTVEGESCVNRAFKAGGKKNFLFVGERDGRCRLMFKLDASADEARRAQVPGDISVGRGGWVTALLIPDGDHDLDQLTRWVDESFHLLAPASVRASLRDG